MNDGIPLGRTGTDVVVDVRQADEYRDWGDERPTYSETKVFFRTSEFGFAVIGIKAILLAAYAEARAASVETTAGDLPPFSPWPTSFLAAWRSWHETTTSD